MNRPIVAIVGRPNVGKSTLFNRLIKQRKAIVDDRPGVTRDRNYAVCTWNGREFLLVDTGGFVPDSKDDITSRVCAQVKAAIDQAEIVLFVLDGITGIQTEDDTIAKLLKHSKKKVLIAANKIDSERQEAGSHDFRKLGFKEVFLVSAANGRQIGELLDAIVASCPIERPAETVSETTKIAIVGRPNVGKSSLFNAILGENRQIVSEIPGTTRDSIDSEVSIEGKNFIFVDTAGLRNKSIYADMIEYYTSLRSLKAIERSDVVLVVLSCPDGVTTGDIKIAGGAAEQGKGLIFIANKWDLISGIGQDEFIEAVAAKAPRMKFAPVVFTVARTGAGIGRVIKAIMAVDEQRKKRIQTFELNEFLKEAVARRHPPAVRGKLIRFFYMTQPEISPPTFVLFCNYPRFIQPDYERFLENRLRERFGFEGTPLKLVFKSRRKN